MRQKIRNCMKRAAGLLTAAVLMAVCVFPSSAAAKQNKMDVICAPAGITAGADGSFLVTDTYNKVIWQVKNGVSILFAGEKGMEDLSGEPLGGYRDGEALKSHFEEPWAIIPYGKGYAVSDPGNHVIRYIENGRVKTLTGSAWAGKRNDRGTRALYNRPTGIAADEAGNLYIADTGNNCIRKMDSQGWVITWMEGVSEPMGLCWKDGYLYAAETGKNRIIRMKDGQIEPVAGSGMTGLQNGAAMQARFTGPQTVLAAGDGTIYVSDTGNNAIRKIQNGAVSTLAVRGKMESETFPVLPLGLMLTEKELYVCDNFSKLVTSVPR